MINLNFQITKIQQKYNIVVFFLKSKNISSNNYLTFSEAVNKKLVDVTEVGEKGFRDRLNVINQSKQQLLILSGEQIIGNKIRQNRIIKHSILIPENTSIKIPVDCGERKRWSAYLNNDLSILDTMYFSRDTLYLRNQFKIWTDISDKLEDNGVKSITQSAAEISKKNKQTNDETAEFFAPGNSENAILVSVNNKFKSLDIFANNKLLKKYLKKIIRGVSSGCFKNINHKNYLRERDAYNFIDEVRQANQYELNVIKGTLGEKILIKGEFLIGDILSYNNQIIHGSVFLKDIVAAGPKKVYSAA